MAQRVGRGIAVLVVVGLCLPLLFWMFGEREEHSPLDPEPRAPQSAALTRPRAQAPAPTERNPSEESPSDPREEGPATPRGGIGPEPAWSDPAVWTGQLPTAPATAAPIYTATVTGRVVDASGHPVPGVKISGVLGIISCWGGPSRTTSSGKKAVTGPDGRFRLDVSSEHLLPSHLGLAPPPETDLIPSQAELPGLGQGDARELGDLPLIQGGRIEGRVSDPSGLPLAGALVRNQQGSLDLDRTLGRSIAFGNRASWGGSQALEGIVDEGYSSGANVLVPSSSGSHSIRGVVFAQEELGPTTTSRKDGRFTLHAVPPGNHTLVALLRPYAVARRDAVKVRAGLATRGVQLQLAPGPVLEVEVLDAHGQPVPGAMVTGTDDEGASFAATTNARGVATSPPLTSRRFDVYVTAEGRRSSSSAVTAPADSERFRLRVTLGRASEIRFQVPETVSIPQSGSVFAVRRGTREWLSPLQEGKSHVFRELTPGLYDVLANGPEELVILARDVLVRANDAVDLGLLTPAPIEPLRVRVLDAAGLPIQGATLEPLSQLGSTSTDERGDAFLILWPGEHPHRVGAFGHAETTLVLSGSGELVVRLAPATSFLTVLAGRAHHAGGEIRARRLTLRRAGGSPISVPFIDRTRVPLPAPGRYTVDVDEHACGEVEVKAGESVEFTAPEPQPVDVELTVLSPEGRPLAGAEVTLSSGDPRPGSTEVPLFTPISSSVTHTDARGVATLTLQRGPAVRELFARVVSAGRATVFPFSLPAGESAKQTLQLPRGSNATLEVDARGLGQPGSLVELKPLTAPSARTQAASLDSAGRALFQGVLPGRYRVTLFESGVELSRGEVEVDDSGGALTLGGSPSAQGEG